MYVVNRYYPKPIGQEWVTNMTLELIWCALSLTRHQTHNISPNYYIVERGHVHILQLYQPNDTNLFKLIKTILYLIHILTMKLFQTRGESEFIKFKIPTLQTNYFGYVRDHHLQEPLTSTTLERIIEQATCICLVRC